jgi:geranylgeranyl diphosphate synthase type II
MQDLAVYSTLLENEITQLDFPKTPSNLYDPLRYFMQLGGKRLRPVLTFLGAELFGLKKEDVLNAALSVEVFHNFTLIHDDIMDEAPLRRAKETVHTKWNQNIAILSGDVLFVKAYQLLAKQEPKHLAELLHVFSRTAQEVCEGQQMDMDFESRSDVSIDEYVEMIRLKTSVLLGCALELGAIVAEASTEDRQHLYDFGQHLGIAFQIQDDILDLYADPDKFGKQVGGDVISNKKTLLNLKAKQLANPIQRELLNQLETEQDFILKVSKTRDLFSDIGAREACEIEMQKHYDFAMNSLKQINVADQNKLSLIALADFVMQRDN